MSTFTPEVRLWPGKNFSLDSSTWGLGVDITSYVRQPGQDGGQVISYSNGRQDEGNQIDAGTLNLTLDNRTGIWTPQNVNGIYYGLLNRNTPIQLADATGSDDFTRSAGAGLGTSSSGQLWTVTSSWALTGTTATSSPVVNGISLATLAGADATDFDMRYTCWSPVVATGSSLIMSGMGRCVDLTDSLVFRCEFTTGGMVDARIGWYHTLGGVIDLGVAANVFSYAANTKIRVRCQADGTVVRMKIWKPANPALPDADEPEAWNATGEDTVTTGTKIGLSAWRLAGNTNVGTPAIAVDDFTVSAVEWTGSVVQWPTRWSKKGNNAWAPIQAAGVLRRLRQGQGELQSPLRRQLMSYSPQGFWPLEDGAGSTQFASAVPGRQPGIMDRVTAGALDDLPGAFLSPTFDDADSSISFRTARSAPGEVGFAVMFLFKLASLPGGTTRLCRIYPTGSVARWEVTVSDTAIAINGYNAGDPTAVHTGSIAMAAIINPREWVAVQLETEITPGDHVDWDFIVHQVGEVNYYAQTGSYLTASTAAPVVTSVTLGGTLLDGASFSSLWIGSNDLPFVDNTFSLVSAGYEGELASVRAARVAAEVGLPLDVEAGDSEPMGAQREGTVLGVLRSCEAADYGLLYEGKSGRLAFRPRTARFNPTNVLTLSMVSGHLAEAPEPVYDDQQLRNVWTLTRQGGSSATVRDEDSIDLDGEVAGSDTINVQQDPVLEQHAAWRVYLGVQEGLRWPSIVLDFARNPSLLTYWRSRRYGFRFAVSTGLTQVAGAEADVIAEGYQAELWPDGWRVTLNCSGASPWDVAVLEDATTPVRLDTAGCVLAEDIDTTEVGWDVSTTTGPIWNTATTFPILMKCEGEIISVSAISGATAAQTLTVTRSVNGVVKAHSTGAAVSLAYPSRLAL